MNQRRIQEILDPAEDGDWISRALDLFIISLIASNVLAVMLETVEGIRQSAGSFFTWFEVLSVVIFTIEYALRVWSCTVLPSFSAPIAGRLRYAVRPMLVIDLLAILPAYLIFLPIDLRALRALRLFRIFRLLKLQRYSIAMQTLSRVLLAKKEELLFSLSALIFLLMISSTLMYYAEHEAQPDAFSSIPATMWWGVSALTTVGYGDVYPVTGMGKVLASVIAILGIGMFALPAGILGGGFAEHFARKTDEKDPRQASDDKD